MTIIDVHNHFYPPEFIDALRQGDSALTVHDDAQGNPVLYSPGDANIAVRGHRDIAYRKEVLRMEGVDHQLISLTCPGTLLEAPQRSVALARLVNDAFARIMADHGDRFTALATLPLNVPDSAGEEFERVRGMGFKGCMLFGNVNGVPLADEQFWPLYERASEARAVLYIHPTFPLGVEAMQEYWLMPLVGFLFDTTLAAAHLVFAGVPERFPGIRWVLGHLGGTIPYLAERLDRGYRAFAECRANLPQPPSTYLKNFFYDTVNFDPDALELAVKFAGAGQILAGSDYPHQIGSMKKMRQSISALPLPEEHRNAILGRNARKLLGLETS
ncbi:MAG TPA: amidohydrolase family protein [Gemmatimonadales bacterium]|nr:amidohydrolase family protein [Gemmatimonadales bacterium]